MSGSGTARGQPLIALLALLAGWIGGRAAQWEAPTLADELPAAQNTYSHPVEGLIIGPQSLPQMAGSALMLRSYDGFGHADDPGFPAPVVFRPVIVRDTRELALNASAHPFAPLASGPSADFGKEIPAQGFFAPEPGGMEAMASSHSQTTQSRQPTGLSPRWSMDAWTLLRPRGGGGGVSQGVLPATYGASQSGAVIRYRLARADRHQTHAYLRTTSALGQVQETAGALGLSARPLPEVPVVLAAEGRVTFQAGSRRFQPAIFAYTQLPPVALPKKFQAEAYLQGGYVGGEFTTLFADGQARLDRKMLQVGRARLRLGAGVWSGAQRGASRLDTGPSMTLAVPLGRKVYSRVALDWRFRVGGNASPGSGPALTLSAGF